MVKIFDTILTVSAMLGRHIFTCNYFAFCAVFKWAKVKEKLNNLIKDITYSMVFTLFRYALE